MSARDPRQAALRRLIREARHEKLADVDFDGIEERLLRDTRRAAPAARRSPYPLAWAVLAVAAAAALWLVGQRSRGSLPHAPPEIIEATEPLRTNGDKLAIGSRVVAQGRELSVDHAGRATWTLSPDSSALLTERGERIALTLEHGSVLSEVVPNPRPETFVVEAGGARIAVHGTVFSVSLEGARVIVQVREGTVAVGPAHAVPAFYLKAPAHGDFALDGRSGSIDGRPLGESEVRRPGLFKPGPAARASGAPASLASASTQPEQQLPLEPSISDIEAGISGIVRATEDCFSRNTKSAEGVQITVRTALSLQITSAGAVSEVEFQPPLSPDVDECASASIANVVFAASHQGAKVTRMLELKR
jgi:hypothetical protein